MKSPTPTSVSAAVAPSLVKVVVPSVTMVSLTPLSPSTVIVPPLLEVLLAVTFPKTRTSEMLMLVAVVGALGSALINASSPATKAPGSTVVLPSVKAVVPVIENV